MNVTQVKRNTFPWETTMKISIESYRMCKLAQLDKAREQIGFRTCALIEVIYINKVKNSRSKYLFKIKGSVFD